MFDIGVVISLAVGRDIVTALLNSSYVVWGLLLVVGIFIGTIVSGLLDIALIIAKFGLLFVLALAAIEFGLLNFLSLENPLDAAVLTLAVVQTSITE